METFHLETQKHSMETLSTKVKTIMTDVIKLGRKAFTAAVVGATVAWSMGLAAFIAPYAAQAASAGDLIKGSLPAVYYYGADGKRYVFPNEKAYKTWYADFKTVKKISDTELAAISLAQGAKLGVTYRPGVKMVKITTDPKVYAVGKGGTLRWVKTEDVAKTLYGTDWSKKIDDIADPFFAYYTIGADIMAAADFTPTAETAAVADIGTDKSIAAAGDTTTTPPPAATGALTVALAPDSPATGSAITDAGNNAGGQRLTAMKLRFTSSGGEAKVTGLKFKRTGIASDSDLDNMYIMDGTKRLANAASVTSGVATFSSSASIFTVPASGSKDVTLMVDLNKDTSAGKTIGWKLDAADVTSDASSVTGSVSSNLFTVAVVTDLGFIDLANVTPGAATTVTPEDNYEAWRFRIDANSQKMKVTRLRLTNVGSIDGDDLQNFKLMDGDTQLGATVALLDGNKAQFDLTGMADGGLVLAAGAQKQLALRTDIKGGTNRTYRFSFQEATDADAYDMNYNVWTVPAADDNAAFSVVQAGGASTISTGSITLTVHTESPAGDVPDGATNVLISKYNMKASGEDMKVTSLDFSCSSSDTANGILTNVRVSKDGSQVGSTLSNSANACNGSSPSGTDFSFGNTFVVKAGTSAIIEIRADLTDTDVNAGDTIAATFVAGSSNAQGTVSLTLVSTSAVSGRTVTVRSGAVVASKNASLADYTSTNPMGVLGSSNVRVGSFVITGGAEPSDVSQIVIQDDVDTTSDTVTLADYFANLRLMHGTTQLGTTTGSLTDSDSQDYTFNVSPVIRVGIGETYVVDVYADLLSTAGDPTSNVNTDDTNGLVLVDDVVATGVTTGTTTSDTASDPRLQRGNIAASGSLRVINAADAPADQQLVLGSTEQTVAKFRFSEESNAEDILVTKINLSNAMTVNTASPWNATGTMRNLRLYKDSTLLATVAAFQDKSANTVLPLATFDLSALSGGGLMVPKGSNVTITVKTDMTPYIDGGTSSTTHRIFVPGGSAAAGGPGDITRNNTAVDDAIVATGKGSGFSISTTSATATSGLVITRTTTGSTQQNAQGNVMDAVRTKISFAHASDAPKGLSNKNSAQVVAKVVVSNGANVGNYAATLLQLNLDINQTGLSATANRILRIYRDSVDTANQLGTTTFTPADGAVNYSDTQITEGNFTDLEIAAGGSRTLIVTLDTDDTSIAANDTISVGIDDAAAGGQSKVQWSDGALPGNLGTTGYTEVNGLPLTGNTLSY